MYSAIHLPVGEPQSNVCVTRPYWMVICLFVCLLFLLLSTFSSPTTDDQLQNKRISFVLEIIGP